MNLARIASRNPKLSVCAEGYSTYRNIGAKADLYSNPQTKAAMHFFDAEGDATWIIFNSLTGVQVYSDTLCCLSQLLACVTTLADLKRLHDAAKSICSR